AHAGDRRRPDRRGGDRLGARRARRLGGAPPARRLHDAGAVGLPRPHAAREPPLLRAASPRAVGVDRPLARRRRPRAARRPRRAHLLRRPAVPCVARGRAARRAGAARARRADRRPRPRAAPGSLDDVPADRRDGDDPARLLARDGRGRPLRHAAPSAGGAPARRLHARRAAGGDRRGAPRRRVPRARGGAMSTASTLATAGRVLRQLRRDPRTLALLFVVPPLLVTLFRYLFDGQPATFDRVGPPMIGIFPFTTMFVVTSIAMLRERTTGTLERLMTLPLAKLDLLAGYGLAFAALATLQAAVTSTIAFWLLGLDVQGSVAVVIALAVCNALLGMSLGLFVSAFARTEFQAVQFLPALVFPQLLLCGLLVPRERMVDWLRLLSTVLPLTWAYDGLARAAAGRSGGALARDVAIVLGV